MRLVRRTRTCNRTCPSPMSETPWFSLRTGEYSKNKHAISVEIQCSLTCSTKQTGMSTTRFISTPRKSSGGQDSVNDIFRSLVALGASAPAQANMREFRGAKGSDFNTNCLQLGSIMGSTGVCKSQMMDLQPLLVL